MHAIEAPISFKGFAIRSIGLLVNDSSPTKVASIFKLEIKPIINLIPVPEFPKSTSVSGFLNEVFLFSIMTEVPLIVIDEPIAFNALAVDMGSSPFKNPSIAISSLRIDPKITALCEMDLSPGQITSPEIDALGLANRFKMYLLYIFLSLLVHF